PSLPQEEEELSLTPRIISVILPEKVPPSMWWKSGSRGLSIAITQALFMLDAFDLNDGTGELLFKRSALPGCRCYSSHKRHLWMKANGHVRYLSPTERCPGDVDGSRCTPARCGDSQVAALRAQLALLAAARGDLDLVARTG